jgi:geranyl-CoA carboxylase beta subunit
MPVIRSKIKAQTASFAANARRMEELLGEVQRLEQMVIAESASKRDKFEKRGQLLPRERVARLLDRGSPFLELSRLAGLNMHDDDGKKSVMGGGSIVGIGVVAGRRCLISASDSAVKGGTVAPMGLRKALRAQEIARENKLPVIYLVESGGANLMYQSEIFVDGGRSFANQARLSAQGIPQIAVVHGSSTRRWRLPARPFRLRHPGAGPFQHLPGRARRSSRPRLARNAPTRNSAAPKPMPRSPGWASTFVRTTPTRSRWRVKCWTSCNGTRCPAPGAWSEPLYDEQELLGIVPADEREPYDVREVIARLVDGSDFLEFKAEYAAEMMCGHARLQGRLVGILGNNGPIQPSGSTKAAQFIQLCDQSATPLIFLQNTTGYMVGSVAERSGAIKHGSKMIQAVANARVPKFTIVLGGSYGAGNYGMCGRGFDPRFIFSWPTARTAVMGGAQAAKVMDIVNRAKIERTGMTANEGSPEGHVGWPAPAPGQGVRRAVRHGAPVGRRDHRSARHPPPARHVPGHRSRGPGAPAAIQCFRRGTHVTRWPASTTPFSNIFPVDRRPSMKYTSEHNQIADTVRKFVANEINPFTKEWEKAGQFPAHELFKKLGDLGLLGIKYPTEFGGMGLDFSYSMVMAEALGDCNVGGVPMAIGVQTDMCTPALARFGSDALRQEFLSPAIAGNMVGCIGVSEAGGGSDVAALKTRAEKAGDDYIINGSKMWITNGMQADWCCLLANTSDGPAHKNKSLIMVPMNSPGITRQKIEKIGMDSSDTAQLFFDNVRVPRRNVIGQEGMGFMLQMLQFQEERLYGAAGTPSVTGQPDRPDHRLHTPAPHLRAPDPGQPGGAFPPGGAAHRGRSAARPHLPRRRVLRLRQGMSRD